MMTCSSSSQIENDFRHVGRRPLAKNLAERPEIARLDQAPDFRQEKFSDHKDVELEPKDRRAPPSFLTLGAPSAIARLPQKE